jgi:general stress protein 26
MLSPSAALEKILKLIRDIRIALVTTADSDGHFHTRPLQTLEVEAAGVLWFFTDWNSPKAHELHHDRRVSVGYADPTSRRYVAVSGTAQLSRDAKQARKLWTPRQRAYFPHGYRDPRLALLRVQIEHAEYWIAPSGTAYTWAAVRAGLTGRAAEILGENARI